MAMKWSDVAANPAFQALSFDEQEEARNQYFNEVVAPRVSQEELDAVRSEFLADTRSTLAPPPDTGDETARLAARYKAPEKPGVAARLSSALPKPVDPLGIGSGKPLGAPRAQEPAKATKAPTPYRDRREALDDAVNLLEEGADQKAVTEAFSKGGIKFEEIVAHGKKRGSEYFDQQPGMEIADPEVTRLANRYPAPVTGEIKSTRPETPLPGADVLLAGAKGVVGGFKMLMSAGGAGGRPTSTAEKALETADSYLEGLRSAAAVKDDEEIGRIMDQAKDGTWTEQVVAAAKAAGVAPASLVAQGLGTSVPVILASLLPGVRESTVARLTAQIGLGAAQGAGATKESIYTAVKDDMLRAGVSKIEAEERADAAQSYLGQNKDQIAIGMAFGALASASGIERTIPIGQVRNVLAKSGPSRAIAAAEQNVIGRGLIGGVTEAVPEFAQGSAEQVAQNIALQREGRDVPTFQGAVGQGTLEALAGFGAGAVTSAAFGRPLTAADQFARELDVSIANTDFTSADPVARARLDVNNYDPTLISPERTARGVADVGPSAPISFTPVGAPTQQAGLVDIVVPTAPETTDVSTLGTTGGQLGLRSPAGSDQLGGGLGLPGLDVDGTRVLRGGDAGLPAADAGANVLAGSPAGQPAPGIALPRVAARATDQDLLARTEAAIAVPENNNAVVEPTEQWFGRKGDGYATQADASQAIGGRQRMFPTLDWKVESMANGKFRLAGYSTAQETNLGTQTPQAIQGQTQGQAPALSGAASPGLAGGLQLGDAAQASVPEIAGAAAPGIADNARQLASAQPELGQPLAASASEGERAAVVGGPLFASKVKSAPISVIKLAQDYTTRQSGVEFAPVSSNNLNEQQRAASLMATLNGQTVTFIEQTAGDQRAMPNGLAVGGKHVMIDVKSEDAPLAVAMHEVVHNMPENIRKPLEGALRNLFKSGMEGDFKTEFNYDDADLDKEIPAMITQAVTKRKDFWNELRQEMGNKDFSAVAELIITRLDNWVRGVRNEYGDGFISKYVTDVEQARSLIAKAYAQSMRDQGLQPNEAVAGDVMASQRSRVDMNFKDVIKRTPELQAAAEKVKAGEMTAAEYDALVNETKPVEPYKSVPAPATVSDITSSLKSDQLERIGKARELKAGYPVGLRLDIPAYSNHGTWVVSVHEQEAGYNAGKSIGYEPVAAATNVSFGVVEKAALNIAGGKPKATIAVMKGNWKPTTDKQAYTAAQAALKSKDWVQVGMDPERHSYFYDRKTMEPVISADEVLQVGPLVLAKKPVFGDKADFMFSRRVSTPDNAVAPEADGNTEDNSFEDNNADVMPPEQIRADGIQFSLRRVEEINDAPEITMQDLVGQTVFPILADLTAAGYVYMGKELRGGPYYTLLPSNSKAGLIWANDGKGVASIKNKKAARGVIGLVIAMKQDSHATNNTVANIIFRAVEDEIQKGSVAEADIPKLDEIVRGLAARTVTKNRKVDGKKVKETKQVFPKFADFPGFSDREASEKFLRAMPFEARGLFFQEMTKPTVEDLGLGVVRKVINDTVEPDLRGLNMGDVVMAIRFDPNADTIELGEKTGTPEHDSYRYGVKGTVIGKFKRPISFQNVFVDLMDERRAAGTDRPAGNYRSLTLRKPEQVITQEIANAVSQEAYKTFKSPAEAKAAVASAAGEWNLIERPTGAGVKEFLRTSRIYGEGKVPSFVEAKKLIKDVDLKIFRLGETENWFAIEKRGKKNVMTSIMVAQPGVRRETLFADMVFQAKANNATHIEVNGTQAPIQEQEIPRPVAPIVSELSEMKDADLVNLGIDPKEINRLNGLIEEDGAEQFSPTSLVMYSNRAQSPADRIKWRKVSDVKTEIGLDSLPRHIIPFATFMRTMADKAANGGLTSRDLIKAYTIARSSMNRSAVTTSKIKDAGLVLPENFVDEKIRPEGAFGYWLLSPVGQRYLNAAEVAIVDQDAVADAVKVMAPFGTQNALGKDLERAAAGDLHTRLPAMTAAIAKAATGKNAVKDWQDATDNLFGVREAKKGFLGSLLGFGQLPTFDARQINVNVKPDSKEDTLRALSSVKARDVVAKLARRMDALSLTMDPEYAPFYQHLAHHAVWDAVGGTETTHSDVIESMIMASNRAKPTFYSQLERVIANVPAKLATQPATQWALWLDSNGPKQGVKKDEVEWSGIKDYLTLRGKDKVTSADLQAYLADSGVKVTETTYRGEVDEDELLEKYAVEMFDVEYFEMSRDQRRQVQARIDKDLEQTTRYEKYTLPGGENYREMLITLPSKNPVAGISPVQAARVLFNKEYSQLTETQQQEVKRQISDDASKPTYMSSHWSDPNVLAHIRVNDRTDADGKRVLFVEEVQSDWGQDGLKKGFGKVTRFEYEVVQDNGQLVRSFRDKGEAEAFAKDRGLQLKEIPFTVDTGIPAAPFVTKTEGWLNLALKRIAMLAVEEGYDKVAFVNGQQSADRYDLSKQISSISYEPGSKPESEGLLQAWDLDRKMVMSEMVATDRVEDYVGKDVAVRLLETDKVRGKHLLDGENIKVGGKGMITFYNQIVPQAITKLLPKIGGEKLGSVGVPLPVGNGEKTPSGAVQWVINVNGREYNGYSDEGVARLELAELLEDGKNAELIDARNPETSQQPGFDVTDKMRETVGAGLPMFSKRVTETPAFRQYSGGAPVIELGDFHEFRSGEPVVVEALHGTTNADLTEFKRSRANIDSDMGAGFYASNTPEDVEANYANVDGPDLTQRVEQLAERLAQDDEFEDDMDAAREEARKRLSEGAPNTMKLYMRFKNPVVIGDNETVLDYSEEYNEETDEYEEPSGLLVDFVEALRDIAPNFNASDREIESAIGKIFEQAEGEGLKVSDVQSIVKSEFLDAFDDDGNSASSEIFRQALSQIGFDGVIDTTVYNKFGPKMRRNGEVYDRAGGMKGMNEGTVHFIAFEPTQIKSATGNDGSFDATNPDIRRSNRRQKLSTIGQNFTLPGTSKFDAGRIKLQDDALRMKRVIEAVKAKGGTVGEAQNFYDANTLMPGRIQATMDDFRDNVMRPLINKAVDFGIDLDELALYAYAKHAKERNAYIASINKRFPDGGSGMTNDHADSILQLAKVSGDEAKFEELHRDLMAITSTTRQLMLAEGLISQDEFNSLDGAYENYIPLRGLENVDENSGAVRPGIGRGINVRGGETIKALGRKSQASDLIENVIRDYQRVIMRVEKNDVGKVLLDFVLSNPDPDLWGVDVERSKPALNKATGLVQYTKNIEKGEDTIGVKVGGQQVYIKLADPELARAIRQAWKDETSGLERATLAMTGWWNNWMRNVLTRYNPAFAAINIPRDALWSGTSAALAELGPKGLAKYLANYGKALMASTRQEAGLSGTANKIIGNQQMDQVFQEFRNAGAITGGFYMRSLDDINKDLRNEMLLAGAKAKNTFEAIKSLPPYKMATLTARMLEFMGSASENATRFALYQAAREVGRTPAQAALLAKDGTTNFNRKGEWGGALNNLYLFFNAAVQGNAQLFKVLKSPAVQASMAGVAGVGVMLAMYGASAGGEDDDGEAYWDKVPSYVKERNLVFMLPPGDALADGIERVGKRGRYFTLPVQYGFNIFPNAGYMMADVFRNAQDPKRGVTPTKAALHMTSTVFGSINPFGGAVDFGDGVQVLLAAMPTLLDLPVQLINERGTFGSPSAPDKAFSKGPDSSRMFTSQMNTVSEKVAKTLNELGGGNTAKAGKIMGVETSVTPGTIQTLISATTGGLGSFVEQVGSSVIAMTGDDKDLKAAKIPFLNKFYGEVDESANIRGAGDRMREIRKLADEVKAQQRDGFDPELDSEEERLIGLASMQESYQKFQTQLRKAEIAIIKDEKMTEPEKKLQRRQIQVERDRLATEVNREYLKSLK